MEHVAIDLGGRESQICIRTAEGKIVEEHRCQTTNLGDYLKTRAKSRVVMETCAESFAIAAAAQLAGHEVRVVPATLVRTLGVGARRLKTDRRDAQALSEVSCRIDLPSVHIRSPQARDTKTLCSMRNGLVQARTQLTNTVRGWLRMQLVKVRSGSVETLPQRVREKFLARPEGMAGCVERQLQAIEALTTQIDEASAEIDQYAKQSKVCQRLMSVPGVGPITATRFTATLDVSTRFPDAHHVGSYLGMTPSEDSSSDRVSRGSITKAGDSTMRWLLVQSAWCLWRTQPHDPMVKWARAVADRRGRRVAIVALARKLAGIMFALWRDETTYNPTRSSVPRTPTSSES